MTFTSYSHFFVDFNRLPVNSSHSQVVTWSSRHTVNSSPVNSSHNCLITQSTRHNKAVSCRTDSAQLKQCSTWIRNYHKRADTRHMGECWKLIMNNEKMKDWK